MKSLESLHTKETIYWTKGQSLLTSVDTRTNLPFYGIHIYIYTYIYTYTHTYIYIYIYVYIYIIYCFLCFIYLFIFMFYLFMHLYCFIFYFFSFYTEQISVERCFNIYFSLCESIYLLIYLGAPWGSSFLVGLDVDGMQFYQQWNTLCLYRSGLWGGVYFR